MLLVIGLKHNSTVLDCQLSGSKERLGAMVQRLLGFVGRLPARWVKRLCMKLRSFSEGIKLLRRATRSMGQ